MLQRKNICKGISSLLLSSLLLPSSNHAVRQRTANHLLRCCDASSPSSSSCSVPQETKHLRKKTLSKAKLFLFFFFFFSCYQQNRLKILGCYFPCRAKREYPIRELHDDLHLSSEKQKKKFKKMRLSFLSLFFFLHFGALRPLDVRDATERRYVANGSKTTERFLCPLTSASRRVSLSKDLQRKKNMKK